MKEVAHKLAGPDRFRQNRAYSSHGRCARTMLVLKQVDMLYDMSTRGISFEQYGDTSHPNLAIETVYSVGTGLAVT